MAALPAPDRHGAELRNVVKALAPRFQVDVMAVKGAEQSVVERYLTARVLRVPTGPGASLRAQIDSFRRAVRRQLEGDDYEVIHLRDAWGGLPVCERRWDMPTRIVYDVALSPHGEPPAADGELEQALSQSEAYCLERADLVLVRTETARRALEHAGCRRVAVVPPGVDVDHFDWEPEPEGERPILLYAGRIAPGRRVRLLLEAAASLRSQVDLEVWLCGPVDPSLRGPLDDTVRALRLTGHVRELGPVEHDDMPRVIARATVCVCTGAPDPAERPLAGPPTKILEYMACRRAVVAPNRPSVAEVLRHGEEGLLFSPGDAHDLEACLRRLLYEPMLRREMADAAYQSVRARYPASATRRRLIEEYSTIVSPASFREIASAGALPCDALPARADTTPHREAWVADQVRLGASAEELERVDFRAAGALLEGGISAKMDDKPKGG
jgi:glycosyltransferase involved in cell wall biosynthesis